MEKHAVYTGTRNLYPRMIPAVKSLLKHSSVDKVHLLIEDDEFPYELPSCVETRNMSGQEWFRPDGPNMKSYFTYMALIRSAFCHIFPDVDVILSLDVDTICVNDIDGLWDIPLEDNYFAASLEHHRSTNGLVYCNIGVCMYNLKLLRESGKADEAIRLLNRQRLQWLEQDAFSYLCQGYIVQMPSAYNSNRFTIPHNGEPTRIRHYPAVPNWTGEPEYIEAEKLTWEEVLGDRS